MPELGFHFLANIESALSRGNWSVFRDGIARVQLYGDAIEGPSASLLRYSPGARLPTHCHTGFEHILILSGEQMDEHGIYQRGDFIVNAPGSQHSVTSPAGCDVLVIWQAPVIFLPQTQEESILSRDTGTP
jgi:anti-sigma factor ChrR (cupin superfamily)